MKGIINTCFLVDWVDYKRRDIFFEDHAVIHLPQHHPPYKDIMVLTAGDIILHVVKGGSVPRSLISKRV